MSEESTSEVPSNWLRPACPFPPEDPDRQLVSDPRGREPTGQRQSAQKADQRQKQPYPLEAYPGGQKKEQGPREDYGDQTGLMQCPIEYAQWLPEET